VKRVPDYSTCISEAKFTNPVATSRNVPKVVDRKCPYCVHRYFCVFTEQDDDERWEQVVKCAQPHQQDANYLCSSESAALSDAVEVFVLANVLRRPIVVLCCMSDHGNSTRSVDVGGIYLPLLWKQDECIRYPLVLASVEGKFVPLVGGDSSSAVADMPSALDIVPLVTAQLEPLPVWFLLESEEHEVYELMQQYMNVTEVNLCQAQSISMVLGARLKYHTLMEMPATTSVAESSRPAAAVRFQSSLSGHLPQTPSTESANTGTARQTGTAVAAFTIIRLAYCN